jgi:tetratricopeptide (TPR) repeat protein
MADLAIGRGDLSKALERLCPGVDDYVAQGDGEKAGSLLKKILNKESHHIETLLKLAEVHTVVGNEHGRLSAYDRLCEAYAQRGNYEKAVDVAQQLVGLEPQSSQHRDRLRFLKSRLGDPAKNVRGAGVDVEIPVVEMEGDDAADDSEPIPALSPEDEEHIKDKVIEVEVYVRYGLAGKAIDQLKNVLQSYRFHTGVREKLIQVYRDEGMRREAAEELAVLSRVYQRLGNEEKAQELLQEAEGLDVAGSEDDSVDELPPEIPDIPSEDEELPEDESEIDWGIPTEESQDLGESLDEGEVISQPSLDPEVAEGSAPLTPALQEVDEYVAMGLFEDARESLRELLGENPESPELLSKIEELGFSVFQLQEGRGVDESSESPNVPELDAIFREFKKGVERQLGTEDYDTRYNLGIAYKEMGLLDEAIAEFQLAAKDETLLLECCSLLGLCFMEKGMHTIAIKWLERGLALPDRSEEEVLGLRYDLARVYETMGDIERALDLYEDIYRVHARFREVSKRVRKLQAVKN